MAKIAGILKSFLPLFPRHRYSIFAGTNSWHEWWVVFRALARLEPADQESAIHAYEKEFTNYTGVEHATSFGAGRMALYAVLEALDIGPGDEVIISGYTCAVVPNAVLYRGARPVYSDIELRTFNQVPEKIEMLITPRTRAIVAQHTFGVPCELDTIIAIGEKHGVPVIEDCGHAQGALYEGRPVGSVGYAGFFTTDHSKISSTHLGGMVTTNSKNLAARLKRIQNEAGFLKRRDHVRLLSSFLLEFILYSPAVYWIGRSILATLSRLRFLFYWQDELQTRRPAKYPYPARLSAQQAVIGLSQLKNLSQNISHRRNIARILEDKLAWSGLSSLALETASWLRYSFLVKDRAAFEKKYKKQLDLGIWFTSVTHGRNANLDEIGYKHGSCPNAEFASRHVVNFPTHRRIPLSLIEKIAERDGDWISHQLIRVAAPAGRDVE